MKTIIILSIIAFASTESNYYDLEDLDMNKLVENIDLLKKVTNCLLEKNPCNTVYEAYRAITVDAIHTKCKRCRPIVKRKYWEYLQAIKTKLPNEYHEYRQKYDPENKYFDALEEELVKYAIE